MFTAPINAESITPDNFAGKSLNEITALNIWEGNRKKTLGELFKVTGEDCETLENVRIEIVGDLRKVKRIGINMSAGEIVIRGDVSMHLGEEMKGGTIIVMGNVGSWAGSMMKGGTIEIKGNAGDYVGAAYRGSTKGMSGGNIIIHGNAGNELGCYMRKGTIKVYGNVGQFAGVHMRNGTIYVKGNSEGRAGACMTGGKIVLCGYIESILPSFTIDSIKSKAKVNGEPITGPFYMFIGDLTEQGKGRLYVSKTQNLHLNFYEKFL